MQTRNLTDLIHFTDDAPRTEVLAEPRRSGVGGMCCMVGSSVRAGL
jgi:hypothetical protein